MKINQFNIRKKFRILGLLIITSLLFLMLIPNLPLSNYKNHNVSVHEKKIDEFFVPQIPRESTVYYRDINGNAYGVYISGNYAYVAAGSSGLAIIDISDPTNPGTPIYAPIYASSVYISNGYAYVAAGSGLGIIDISTPTNPGTPIYKNLNGSAQDVFISGDYAYIAVWGPGEPKLENTQGLVIIDISDPTNPGTPIYKDAYGTAKGVYISGDYAYIAVVEELPILVIINISDPTNPGTSIDVQRNGQESYGAFDVCVSENYAYLANTNAGMVDHNLANSLAIIDVSDPTNPGTPIYKDTTGTAHGVYISGDNAFIADGPSGLAIINISDPTSPGTPLYVNTTGNAFKVYVQGDYAYVADGTSGLAIIHIRELFGPKIVNASSDFKVDLGYTEASISWTATDQDPNNYTIELQGSGVVFGPTPWVNGTEITYIVPVGLAVGEYNYKVNFTDVYDNFVTDTVIMTVKDIADPIITNSTSDFTINPGYTRINISWTAIDQTPNTYTITLQGTDIIFGPSTWSNGTPITYNIPDGLAVGEYNYTVRFTDDYNNYVTDTIIMSVKGDDLAISFGNYYLTFLIIGIILLVIRQKRRNKSSFE